MKSLRTNTVSKPATRFFKICARQDDETNVWHCLEVQSDDRIVKHGEFVVSYILKDGHLFLSLMAMAAFGSSHQSRRER